MQDFKHIRAWERAHALAVELHRLSRGFARAGHSNLRSQLIRSAASIATNVVEGCGATGNRDFARFLDIAVKSANETEYHLLCARDFDVIARDEWQRHTQELIEIRKMIYVYRKRVLEKK